MSNLSQFYNSGDGIELEVWVVAGGGGGGAANSGGGNGRGGSGGGGGIFYDRFMVPLGSTIYANIGSGGAGGTYNSGTNFAFSGSTGGRSGIAIYAPNYRLFGKAYTVAGGGSGGYSALYSGRGGDGGCGGGKGNGYYSNIDPSQSDALNEYRATIGLYGSNDGNTYGGLSYYVKKRTSLNNSSTSDGSNTVLYPGYYGEHAVSNITGGGVMMQIPALLNQTTPSYYNNGDLWGYDYEPHNDVPVVSVPGHFSNFNGYANTGNGGIGGNPTVNGSAGSSGFVLIRYPSFYGTISTNSFVTTINTNTTYNTNLRGYIITGTATVTLPTS